METFECTSPRINPRSASQNAKKRSRDVQPRTTKSTGTLENEKKIKEDDGPELFGVGRAVPLRDITNRFLEEPKACNHRRKDEIARERWKMLAKALLKPKTVRVKDISVRRFASFDLITPNKLEKVEGRWLKYSTKIYGCLYDVEVHHLEPKLTPKDLIGFNNTGNICIWPSEEVLAFHLLTNRALFAGKAVLEVGGGMTCLAGLMLARHGAVGAADLTDGNPVSVDNVQNMIRRNEADASAFVLDWADHRKLRKTYDVVLSSDCLFFDETRSDLVETVWNSLKEDGVGVVMAPKRGNTLDSFVQLAAARGFCCNLQTHYSEMVWKQHLKFKKFNPEYQEDLHYPVLLLLTKSSRSVPLS